MSNPDQQERGVEYVYIVIHKQTISLYLNSLVWLDTRDAWIETRLILRHSDVLPRKRRNFTYIYINIYAYRPLKYSVHSKSFAYTILTFTIQRRVNLSHFIEQLLYIPPPTLIIY